MEQLISEKTQVKNLHFKWTVSRGRDTYGYNICTLLVDGDKVASCNGGGYDMQGTALANWLNMGFQAKLCKLFENDIKNLETNENARTYEDKGAIIKYMTGAGFYGVTIYYNTKNNTARVSLDGACGFNSIERIAEAIGIKLKWNKESDKYKNHSFYTAFIN